MATITSTASDFNLTSVSLKIGSGPDTDLVGTDYTLSSSNVLTIPSSSLTSRFIWLTLQLTTLSAMTLTRMAHSHGVTLRLPLITLISTVRAAPLSSL